MTGSPCADAVLKIWGVLEAVPEQRRFDVLDVARHRYNAHGGEITLTDSKRHLIACLDCHRFDDCAGALICCNKEIPNGNPSQ